MKMPHGRWDRDRLRLNERGVALPLALFGLVAVSLLVTSALLTSSTELAISSAHQDATRGLYAADEALEQFVAQRAALVSGVDQRFANGSYSVDGGGYAVNVAELFRSPMEDIGGGVLRRRETYSLIAEPGSGRGRSVGALVEAVREAAPVNLNVDSGLTLGVNTTVSGSATISDGSSEGAACDSASATAAIRHSSDTNVTQQGNGSDIIGSIQQDTLNAAALMSYVLDGSTLEDLAKLATIRFGPTYSRPAFSNADGPKQNATDVQYRWGCPVKLMPVGTCSASQAAHFPIIALDAAGGTIDISGDHGQGMIIVRNGHINIRGTFLFQGIILVEGSLRVTGTPRLEGAVIAMGEEAIIDPGDDGFSAGNSLIRFNKCEIVAAQRSLTVSSLETTEQVIATSTFAWFEVVR